KDHMGKQDTFCIYLCIIIQFQIIIISRRGRSLVGTVGPVSNFLWFMRKHCKRALMRGASRTKFQVWPDKCWVEGSYLVRCLVQPPGQLCDQTRLLIPLFIWVLKLSKDGDYTTTMGNCSNSLLSSWSGKAAIRSLLRHLFYRPNKLSSLSFSSLVKCFNSLAILPLPGSETTRPLPLPHKGREIQNPETEMRKGLIQQCNSNTTNNNNNNNSNNDSNEQSKISTNTA
ncbi:unnamed protein product, partial [Bubo scandiacus]